MLPSLCRSEFNRVEDLDLAHRIWSTLRSFHKGTNMVKAYLFETYRRLYENFSHLRGESTDWEQFKQYKLYEEAWEK